MLGNVQADRLREALAAFPRIRLALLPTPLLEAPRLSARLGRPRILVKRGDLAGLGTGDSVPGSGFLGSRAPPTWPVPAASVSNFLSGERFALRWWGVACAGDPNCQKRGEHS